MNRNRVSDGRQATSSRRPMQGRAGAEVIYVGRTSSGTARDGQLFQEMPESPWPALEATRAAEAAADNCAHSARGGVVASAGVPAPIASASSGATVILGINLSGPIVFQADAHEEEARETRDDSNGTSSLPSGEMSIAHVASSPRGAFPSTLTSLMTVGILAFSLGLIVSPRGEAPATHGAATAPAALARVATGQAPPVAAPTAPLIVPTTLPIVSTSAAPSPRAKASMVRASRVAGNSPRAQTAPQKLGAGRKMFSAASVRASASSTRAATEPDFDAAAEDSDRPSRKSVEKESVDLTKQHAAAVDRKPASKPWVDPWAD